MAKVMTVLRTAFLVFIVAYTVRGLPIFSQLARTFDEQYARCREMASILQSAAWMAIAWIALDTAVGWIFSARRRELPKATMPPQA
jgi:hypothetical protein